MPPPKQEPERTSRGWSRRRWLKTFAALGGLSVFDAAGLEPRWLRIRTLTIGGGSSVRFAFFTDLHFKGNRLLGEAVVERVNRERPAFVAFGGDLVEKASHLPAALELISRIEVPVFGVPGNHDYSSRSDFGEIDGVLRRRGGRWLVDEAADLAEGKVRLSGFSCRARPKLAVKDGVLNVGLMHYPAWVDQLSPGWDLVLAGHSHGGQVRLPLLGALTTPTHVGRYILGRFKTDAGPLYVSSGVGTLIVNVRFLCPPELVFVQV